MMNFLKTTRVRKVLLISAAAVFSAAVLLFSVGPFSVGAIEARLQAGAESALSLRGHDWAHVRMNGQTAIVTGAAPTDTARADALSTVAASTWSGGRVAGGVTRVIDETVDARLEHGFVFRADVAMNGRVLLRGDATDASAREALTRYAENQFAHGADTDLTLVPGGSASAAWQDTATRLLGQLARLDRGALVLQSSYGVLVGEAANPQTAQSVASALSSLPEPYQGAWIITPTGMPAQAHVPDVEACAAIIRAAQGADTLRFDRQGSSPSPLTAVALRRVGRVFQSCPSDSHLTVSVLREALAAGLDTARVDEVAVLLGNGVAEDPRVTVELVQDQDRAIRFSVTTLGG
ncbi:hypothetical protein [Maricaulis parjimensis]|uniref:hypothetical protein n=1 Tax=Maricaulis parjimensis TaxID=144023 RepID=UPI0019397317|nr:hypothetical protein [Maricaulis parjimensis]